MSRPIIRTHNVSTDEVIDREMNDQEYAAFQSQQKVQIEMDKATSDKEEARQALLIKLGITKEEAQLLLS